MPSSFPTNESSPSLVPPTPESDITNSPRSPHSKFEASAISPGEPQLAATPQKRKAGRKPLYKTAQERRDRNRRAQLAFRARRSDYLARLEETCRSLENVVMELQQSNRVANDALNRERNKVKCLERMLQATHVYAPQQNVPIIFSPTSTTAIAIPTDNNIIGPQTGGQQGASNSHIFSQAQSLISLEQQFSPTMPSSATLNNVLFTDNYLGMLPLPMIERRVLVVSCRSVTGISSPSSKYTPSEPASDRCVRARDVSTDPSYIY